jgi:transcriptional regulator with XRE-family HTH domain
MTFGELIADLRTKRGLTLRELARQVLKEDGKPISFQYLSELENDTRNPPPDYLIDKLASVLKVSRNLLFIHARRIPRDLPLTSITESQADKLYTTFRKKLRNRPAA